MAFGQWQESRGEEGEVRKGGLASGDAGRGGRELFDEGLAAAHGTQAGGGGGALVWGAGVCGCKEGGEGGDDCCVGLAIGEGGC